MKIGINKKTTLESLQQDVLVLKEELSKLWERDTDLSRELKELEDKLHTKGDI
jgi:cell division protein FtsB